MGNLNKEEEEAAAIDLVAIVGLIARSLSTEQAVAILMSVVAEVIEASPYRASYWDQLVGNIEGYRRVPSKTISRGSSRVQ